MEEVTGMNVVIVGAGELGQAVALHLREKQIATELWDVNAAIVPGQKALETIVPSASHVFLCVPSWATRAAVASVSPLLASTTTVVSFAKGMEATTKKTVGELLEELLPQNQPFAMVGGPMIAEEIARQGNAVAVIASSKPDVASALAAMLTSATFRTETTADVKSVSLASTLKNIYALALGIADGLGLSGNEKGWIASQAVCEMTDIAKKLGADPAVILGTAGVGDFLATGYSSYSRNHEIGHEIVKTGVCTLLGEGPVSLPSLVERLGSNLNGLRLLRLINAVVADCSPAKPAFDALFASHDAT